MIKIKKRISESRINEVTKATINEVLNNTSTSMKSQKCGFIDSDDCEPLTYDYLISRNKGLPKEYFEPTEVPYDPDEIAMYTTSEYFDIDEG